MCWAIDLGKPACAPRTTCRRRFLSRFEKNFTNYQNLRKDIHLSGDGSSSQTFDGCRKRRDPDYDGIVAFSQTDFTEDLKKITVPVLVMHSEDDQIVPYVASGPQSARLLKNGTLKTYKDFPHGMPTTHAETINADLLAFLKS